MQNNNKETNNNVPAKKECRTCKRGNWAAEFLKKQPCDACKGSSSKKD